ncbi:MAG: hypothetical protein PUA59_04295 [Clostridium sp.]|nr:hypothetical protein [Clostridium sp.]
METAFTKSLPIMGSYLFVSMAYGLVMQEAAVVCFFCFSSAQTALCFRH